MTVNKIIPFAGTCEDFIYRKLRYTTWLRFMLGLRTHVHPVRHSVPSVLVPAQFVNTDLDFHISTFCRSNNGNNLVFALPTGAVCGRQIKHEDEGGGRKWTQTIKIKCATRGWRTVVKTNSSQEDISSNVTVRTFHSFSSL